MKHMNQAAKYNVLRLPEVKSMTGLSRSAIYARIKDGSFPRQVNLGGRAVAWLQSDIEAWLKNCIAHSRMGR